MSSTTCPICGAPKKPTEILCRTHWYQVPKPLRDEVWRLYREAPGSPEHRAAVRSALESVRTEAPHA